jgi:glycine/D-amino acid oxidase-like deaminating enzyme
MPRKLDLRSGRPVWLTYRTPTIPTEPLTRDVSADVAIVGMGISGAMMAETLTARGLSVIMLDRRGPMLGSTPATTALVQFEIDEPITSLSDMIGRQSAEQAWRRSRLSVDSLRARIDELGIDCRLGERPSLYLAGNTMGPGELRDEAEARRRAGIHATYLPPKTLQEKFGIERDGAVLSHGNLALDPRKLTAGLLLKALERKARFYAAVEATGMERVADRIAVTTKDGPTITVDHVVLATGYELMDGVPASEHRIISTWALATRPQPRAVWPKAAFIWEASDPYLYMRATPDGRVICGGEDEDFSDEDARNALLPQKTERIAEKLKELMPQLDPTPDFSWTGSFGTTTTGLPYIGALPGKPNVHSVLGYGGNGITFSRIASEIIGTAISGGEDSDAALFAFGRTSLRRRIVDVAGRFLG